MLDQGDLARAVALVHAADLRHGDVRLVDDAEHVLGEVVDEGVGRLARGTPVEVARVVLDAVAVAHGLEHLEVVARALLESLGLEQLVGGLELGHATRELLADGLEGVRDLGTLGHVVRRRPDGYGVELARDLAGRRVYLGDELDLVAKERDAHRVLGVGRPHVDHVATHAEGAAREVEVVAVVLDVDEGVDEVVALEGLVAAHVGSEPGVVLGAADAVDARDRGDDDHVATREQRRGCLVAQLLDLLVDGGVLLDVGIGLGDVCLGLVVVVIGDEVDHGVVGEQLTHLRCHLGCKRLVGLDDERGLVERLDGLGHGEGLARARDAHERLVAQAVADALRELLDRLGLVSAGFVRGMHGEGLLALPRHAESSELCSYVHVRPFVTDILYPWQDVGMQACGHALGLPAVLAMHRVFACSYHGASRVCLWF